MTAMKKQTTTSQAIASDSAYALDMAPNFTPDIDMIVSEGIAAFGVKGAGKSNVCARMVEQLSRYPLPYILFDTKGEYVTLADIPHATRFVVATANACPSGYEILTDRLHVVMDLRSWDNDQAAALAMAQLLRELLGYAGTQAIRIPCPCILDEAQYWLPQGAVSYLSKDISRELRDAWHVVATRGRSLGLVPSYFTQNISELSKAVVRQCGLYILMRQVLNNDLDRYAEYIRSSSPAQLKGMIRAFSAGRAIVILPNGEQIKVQFSPRSTPDTSATPTVRGLMARLSQSTQEPQSEQPTPPAAAAQVVLEEKAPRKPTRTRKAQEPELPPAYQRIYAALDQESGLSPMELTARIGCDLDTAKAARATYFTPSL